MPSYLQLKVLKSFFPCVYPSKELGKNRGWQTNSVAHLLKFMQQIFFPSYRSKKDV
jgi:hypothetical protein